MNNRGKCPGGGVSARFNRPGRGVLNSFLPGGGKSPTKRIAQEICPGGWSGLELIDT